MNAHVITLNQRVISLETVVRAPTPPSTGARRDVNALEGGIRARMQALDVNAGDADPAADDWEVAGAGAATQGKHLKSGAYISAQQDVKIQFDYPHKHVMRGAGRSAPLALDLSLSEFVLGYNDMMDAPGLDPTVRSHMSQFLKLLMEDTNVRPWPAVRHFHMLVIQKMEAGQLQWGDVEGILAIQRQHARSGFQPAPNFQPAPSNSAPRRAAATPRPVNPGPPPMFCALFQSGACESSTDHNTPQGFVQHICAFCLRLTGRPISSHGEKDCRRKKLHEESKNGP